MSEIAAKGASNPSLPEPDLATLLMLHKEESLALIQALIREKNLPFSIKRRLEPEEIYQNACMRVQKRYSAFLQVQRVPFKTWLRGQIRDALVELIRHEGAQRRCENGRVDFSGNWSRILGSAIVASITSPTSALKRQELTGCVAEAMQDLEEVDRQILMLRLIEGLGAKAVGEALGLSTKEVNQKLSKVTAALEKRLLPYLS